MHSDGQECPSYHRELHILQGLKRALLAPAATPAWPPGLTPRLLRDLGS